MRRGSLPGRRKRVAVLRMLLVQGVAAGSLAAPGAAQSAVPAFDPGALDAYVAAAAEAWGAPGLGIAVVQGR